MAPQRFACGLAGSGQPELCNCCWGTQMPESTVRYLGIEVASAPSQPRQFSFTSAFRVDR